MVALMAAMTMPVAVGFPGPGLEGCLCVGTGQTSSCHALLVATSKLAIDPAIDQTFQLTRATTFTLQLGPHFRLVERANEGTEPIYGGVHVGMYAAQYKVDG